MKVIAFDIQKGIFNFELNSFRTQSHAHPAIEVVCATKGCFSITTPNSLISDLTFAIVDANIIHQIFADNCEVKLLMIESYNSSFYHFLKEITIQLEHGIFVKKNRKDSSNLFKQIINFIGNNQSGDVVDIRIQECLNYFNSENASYTAMMETLKSKINISESRLSHLFKEKIGISLKKYLVWCRLKKAFHSVLEKKYNLHEASIESGFYDQAHLSKAFKDMLGINPSEVYNSRTLQD